MPESFIQYHGGNDHLYKDGTRKLVKFHCANPTLYPFWKDTQDVANKVAQSTRGQLKHKPKTELNEILSYQNRKHSISNTNIVEFKPVEVHLSNRNLTGDELVIDETNVSETVEAKHSDNKSTNNKMIPEIHSL